MAADATRTARGHRRREQVLDAAAGLFLDRGYVGTSIDEIGAAAGISGPGLYRHFPSKDAVLMELLDRLWLRMLPAVEEAEEAPGPDTLERLLQVHLDAVFDPRGAILLLIRELGHLPQDYRNRARANHARYVAAWSSALREQAPGLDETRARTTVAAVHGLLDSVVLNREVGDGAHRRRALLADLARAVVDRAADRPADRGARGGAGAAPPATGDRAAR